MLRFFKDALHYLFSIFHIIIMSGIFSYKNDFADMNIQIFTMFQAGKIIIASNVIKYCK